MNECSGATFLQLRLMIPVMRAYGELQILAMLLFAFLSAPFTWLHPRDSIRERSVDCKLRSMQQ